MTRKGERGGLERVHGPPTLPPKVVDNYRPVYNLKFISYKDKPYKASETQNRWKKKSPEIHFLLLLSTLK